jgi:glycosyltransferase involved in cell wall biosynthesis
MKILFISHEATRTGAPLILLHLLKWLKGNSQNIQFDVLLINGGVIEDDFKKECTNTFIYSELFIQKPLKFTEILKESIKSKFGIKRKKEGLLFFEKIASNNYDLIYANSIASIPKAVKIKKHFQKTNLIVHVHELDTIIKMVLPDFKNYLKEINKFIAVSALVADNLIENYNIDAALIDVIYEFGMIEPKNVQKNNKIFTVGASGTTHWRKGDDIFIQVANFIAKNYSAEIEFVWVGNAVNNKLIIESDIKKLDLQNKVKFVGEHPDPIHFYQNFDVFLLTSREDPFPLVCIEAANLGIPIICFEKATGTSEIIKKGGGFVVPYLDIQMMAEKIIFYNNNMVKRIEDGKKAKELFAEFTVDKIAPLLYQTIISQSQSKSL